MHLEVNGTRLWFDVDGPALLPDGREMRERPTVVPLHGGPGSFDHSYFKPDFARLTQEAQVIYLDRYWPLVTGFVATATMNRAGSKRSASW